MQVSSTIQDIHNMSSFSPRKGNKRVDLRHRTESNCQEEVKLEKTEIRSANRLLEKYFDYCGLDKQGKDAEMFKDIILSHIRGETNFILGKGSVTRLEGQYNHNVNNKKPIIPNCSRASPQIQHSYSLVTVSQESMNRR